MSLLVICEILGHFVNTLTADDKYSLCNTELLLQPIQMQLSKKEKIFRIFCSISGMYISFLTFKKKKMTLIAYIFPKLVNPKDVVR